MLFRILLLLFLFSTTVEASKTLTYSAFGHLPMIESPSVSPNGDKIAAVYNSDDGPSVVVSDFGSNVVTPIAQLKKSRDRIDDIYWVNNTRLLIIASYSEKFFNRYFKMTRVFSVNIDGSDLRELKRKVTRDLPQWELQQMGDMSLVSLLKKDDEHVILQTYDTRDKGQSVYKVNVYTGNFEKLFANTYNVYSWVVDEKDNVVFGYGVDEKERDVRTIWYRKNVDTRWQLLHERKLFEGETFYPVVVQNEKLYVLSDRQTGKQSLWLYDIATGEFESMLFGHDEFDVEGVLYNNERNKVVGAYYFEHFKKHHYFVPENTQLSTLVKNTFKKYQTTIYSLSKDKKKLLVSALNDNSPGKFFWLDLEKKAGGFWFSQYPKLEKQPLANVQPFYTKAKDGLPLSGYLTLPQQSSGDKPPLIVWPHGGPLGVRDYMYFDPYVQFFAAKGYAVLQVNYRGSGGFGSKFQASGHLQWGKAMQQDVYDGVDWLLEKNLVDKKRMCFAGYSYGGYAALTAAFQKPNQYDCIISIAGVSDLLEMAEKDYAWEGTSRAFVLKTLGDPTNDKTAEELKSLSAINNIDKIKAPILLLHGTHDTQVRTKQSSEFYQEAKDKGLDIKYVEYKWGTHYLDEQDNRLDAFKQMEDFLEQHLK
ncbi:S9 family peptidase [Thalassotalea sp. 1_MG-2023]|uniref:alpha/beta hydrolase family protein n=1 Tax=Thalassotalea sp. 1_MG-2023 TaxID=3062680 RepID=UPI0026E15B5A|nr:S9 family peptidase [Thalassotalea sp. 1_MG-2023]MDO6427209.1 S9 family peptidase [Thalassotalea sp. 1_MG-2023]